MADKMMRIAGRGADGTAKPVKTDNDGSLNARLTGEKVKWIDHLEQTLTPNNNTTFADHAYRNVSSFDRIDVYISCNTVFDYVISTAKNDLTFKKTYPKVDSIPPSTCHIVTLRTDDGELILPDRLNVQIINKSNSVTADIVVKYRGYKGVIS